MKSSFKLLMASFYQFLLHLQLGLDMYHEYDLRTGDWMVIFISTSDDAVNTKHAYTPWAIKKRATLFLSVPLL